MEHVFNQFTAFLRSWHCLGANETPVAGTPERACKSVREQGREDPTLRTAEDRWLPQDD